MVLYVMLVIAVLIHLVWMLVPAAELRVMVMVILGVTGSVPVAVVVPQPPVKVTV